MQNRSVNVLGGLAHALPPLEGANHLTLTFWRKPFSRPRTPAVEVEEPTGDHVTRRIQRFAGKVRSSKPVPSLRVTLDGIEQAVECRKHARQTGAPFVTTWSFWAEVGTCSNDAVLEVEIAGSSALRRPYRRTCFEDRCGAPLVLLQHIPKTAGTSLRAALEQHQTIRMLGLYPDPAFMKPQEADGLSQSAFDDLDVIVGHFYHGLHRRTDRACQYVTVLRHPADLIRSYYLFMKYKTGSFAQHGTIEDAFTDNFQAFDNVITRYMSGVSPGRPIDEDVASVARHNLATDYAFIGFMDNMPACVSVIGDLFGVELDDFVFNVTPETAEAKDLSRSWIMDRFAPFLKHDLELYELAHWMFAEAKHLRRPCGSRQA